MIIAGLDVGDPTFITAPIVPQTPENRVLPSERIPTEPKKLLEDRCGITWEQWFQNNPHGLDPGILSIKQVAWWLDDDGELAYINELDLEVYYNIHCAS
jgi:hypothetical protein